LFKETDKIIKHFNKDIKTNYINNLKRAKHNYDTFVNNIKLCKQLPCLTLPKQIDHSCNAKYVFHINLERKL